ncbi:MAG: sigma-70 family RNA polymerase sigma factor [Candidatus Aminicenantes bacterium]|nr:sigma-70 family RNA polymerase sigma factor [Candidatus Aminicenantes bacterium]NIM83002.1 sigma-70 family RNA polymerase sigma factor [Candidatus Aminicenantes bacterium]NIN22388.1 sigma-70 family RNA polymerase sigma factor [Candidatus Aminicenantes bacterium]NIN46156.1 sigma-70 family RNA polymerase sigma factor [Candidatus Aminicenantes bacterium]NIN88994.1 sigma-70 family RNA polymerase sigma factor [Candidatus Aminicenantes bacterium]
MKKNDGASIMENLFNKDDTSESTDEWLITEAVNGNRKALEELLQRHHRWIYNIALRMVGEPFDAEDVTQEVLIKILLNIPKFKMKSRFRTWAYRIVVNHVINMKKRECEKKRTSFNQYSTAIDNTPDMDLPDPQHLPVDTSLILEEVKIHCMMGMLLCLNRKERLVFVFGEIFQFSGPVSSEILECSNDNFRQILSRARRKVYNFMRGKCGLIDKKNTCHCNRKAKALMDGGVIDPHNLYFTGHSLFKLSTLMKKKYYRLHDLVKTQCQRLFKEQPFFESPDFVKTFRQILDSNEFKDVFSLN